LYLISAAVAAALKPLAAVTPPVIISIILLLLCPFWANLSSLFLQKQLYKIQYTRL
jgi:hypothetical protein